MKIVKNGSNEEIQKYLKEILDYDYQTGWLVWRIEKGGSRKIGLRAGYRQKNGYRAISIDRIKYHEARIIFILVKGRWPYPKIDHKNRIRDDNRWDNLREADDYLSNNNRNTRSPHKKKTDLPQGVLRNPNGKRFIARARKGGKSYHMGTYDTPKEAHQAYLDFIMCEP
jgi:hypothetical protein